MNTKIFAPALAPVLACILMLSIACTSESQITSKANQLWDCLEDNPGYLQQLRDEAGMAYRTFDDRKSLVNGARNIADPIGDLTDEERAEQVRIANRALDNWIRTCETRKIVN